MFLQLAAVYKEAESKISTEPALLLVAALSHADAVAAEPFAQPLLAQLLDQCSAKVRLVLGSCWSPSSIAGLLTKQSHKAHYAFPQPPSVPLFFHVSDRVHGSALPSLTRWHFDFGPSAASH